MQNKQLNRYQIAKIYKILKVARKSESLDKAIGLFSLAYRRKIHNRDITEDKELLIILNFLLKSRINYVYKSKSVLSALRIYFCYHNKDWFGYYYLGSRKAECQTRWRKNWSSRRHFQAAPRAHGKSHVYSLEFPAWSICYEDNIRILVASKNDKLTRKFMKGIRGVLLYNQKIQEDFGNLTEDVNPLTGEKIKLEFNSSVIFCRRTNHALKDGTVEAISWESASVGSRFDLIIIDDPIDETSCRTANKRKSQIQRLHEIEELLESKGRMLVIGTRKHFADLYSYLMRNIMWTYTIDKAIISPHIDAIIYEPELVYNKDKGQEECVGIKLLSHKKEDINVLWSEQWSIEELLMKKEGMPVLQFLRENQNEINSDETSEFPLKIIERCEDINQENNRLSFYNTRPTWAKYVSMGVDLSCQFDKKKAEENDNDYFVITLLAVDHNNRRHRINCHRERGLDADEQLSLVKKYAFDFSPDIIIVESNQYQSMMVAMTQKAGLPVIPHNTGREKRSIETGLPRMSIEMKGKGYVFYSGCHKSRADYDILKQELHGYGVEEHDDMVMSLWLSSIGVQMYLRYRMGISKKAKKKLDKKLNRRLKKEPEKLTGTSIIEENKKTELSAIEKLLAERVKNGLM